MNFAGIVVHMVTAMVIEYTSKFMGHPATVLFDVMLESTITNLYEEENAVHVDAAYVAIDGKHPSHMLTGAAFATIAVEYNTRLLEDAMSIAAEEYWAAKWSGE